MVDLPPEVELLLWAQRETNFGKEATSVNSEVVVYADHGGAFVLLYNDAAPETPVNISRSHGCSLGKSTRPPMSHSLRPHMR